MKKSAMLLTLILLAFSGAARAAGDVGDVASYSDAKAEAAKLGKPLLLDFYATW